jgi:aspartate dehydrogenase
MTRIGLVGCGAIAREVLRAVDAGRLEVTVAGVTTRSEATAREFFATLTHEPPLLSLDALIEASDLVIELAGGHVVPELAQRCFDAGTALMVISIGALLDRPEIIETARQRGRRLILPSGAIAGLDAIKSASAGRLDRVEMTSRKSPLALAGAPFLAEHGLSIAGLSEPLELFYGPAREVVRGFPDNLNISAAVSLAGLGPDRTMVRVICDPAVNRNKHDIEVEGDFGRLHISIENIPSENPKTGRLTAMSIIRSIQDASDPVRIGT